MIVILSASGVDVVAVTRYSAGFIEVVHGGVIGRGRGETV